MCLLKTVNMCIANSPSKSFFCFISLRHKWPIHSGLLDPIWPTLSGILEWPHLVSQSENRNLLMCKALIYQRHIHTRTFPLTQKCRFFNILDLDHIWTHCLLGTLRRVHPDTGSFTLITTTWTTQTWQSNQHTLTPYVTQSQTYFFNHRVCSDRPLKASHWLLRQ